MLKCNSPDIRCCRCSILLDDFRRHCDVETVYQTLIAGLLDRLLAPVRASNNTDVGSYRAVAIGPSYAPISSRRIREWIMPRHHSRDPEIGQLDGAIFVRQDVGSFDVAMYHTLGMQVDQALQDLKWQMVRGV